MNRLFAFILSIVIVFGSVISLTSCFPPLVDNGIWGDSSDDNADINNTDPEGGENTKPEGGENTKPEGGENTKPEGGENTKPEGGENTNPEGGENTNPEGGENTDPEGGENTKPEGGDSVCQKHIDDDNNDYCDICNEYVIVVIDLYMFNDLHGKFCDTSTQPGVDEIGTYLNNRIGLDDNIILLSTGDMWQGSAESTLTKGRIIIDWMNKLGFSAMTLGNHEFDWGESAIKDNTQYADFPFLAINIYDNNTGKLADYCTPSVIVEKDGLEIGIIGAIGDCYSSISSDMVSGVNFKTGSALTSLVKAESERLRSLGVDLIVYSIHDGSSGYDEALSNGYVDIVFEGHTHSSYTQIDSYGVYHIQGGGENYGFSHIEVEINSANNNNRVTEADIIRSSEYANLDDHIPTEEIEDSYSDIIDYAYADLGYVSRTYSDSQIEDYVAQLYLEAGLEKWSGKYNIVLGGGFLRTRTPYDLTAGVKTYSDLLSLFPFNNSLVLCSVSGKNLNNKFINSTSSDYHIALSSYGSSLTVSNTATYYIVVDTYTAYYAPNGLTIVEFFDDSTYARDLLADAIVAGKLDSSNGNSGGNSGNEGNNGSDITDNYDLTSIPEALAIGEALGKGQSTSEYYYIKGTVNSTPNSTYGNLYLVDENGNEIYVYGLYDVSGKLYNSMVNKPQRGDTVIVYSTIYKYSSGSTVIIELKNATLLQIN